MPAECIDGRWQYTGHDSLHELQVGHRVRPDLWKFVNKNSFCPHSVIADQEPDPWGNRYEGRVIVDWTEEEVDVYTTGDLGETDVVQWPLYYGGPHPTTRGPGTGAKLPAYEANLAILRETAPRLAGVLLGNCGGELAYHHLLCAPDQKQREWCIDRDVEFVRETGALVRDAGGRPFYGPMEREVLIDCYHGDWRMGRAVQEVGGVMVVFQEGGLFPRWTMIYGNSEGDAIWLEDEDEPHPDRPEWRDDYGVFVARPEREPYPYPTLLAYFREFEVWHCIGYDREFRLGYDRVLWRHNCRAVVY